MSFMSETDAICNSPSSPLINIICFKIARLTTVLNGSKRTIFVSSEPEQLQPYTRKR